MLAALASRIGFARRSLLIDSTFAPLESSPMSPLQIPICSVSSLAWELLGLQAQRSSRHAVAQASSPLSSWTTRESGEAGSNQAAQVSTGADREKRLISLS